MNNTFMKVETWLPVFSGFYGTIWETDGDEEREIEYINEQRQEKGLEPVEWDAIEWDYKGYIKEVCEGFTRHVEKDLQALGMVSAVKFQTIRSPREYNFTNDAVDVEISLTSENKSTIKNYLLKHADKFTEYITETYTSRSGFISSHSSDSAEWLENFDETLEHPHRLGAVLNFILLNEDEDAEMVIHEHLTSNGAALQASNYSKLVRE